MAEDSETWLDRYDAKLMAARQEVEALRTELRQARKDNERLADELADLKEDQAATIAYAKRLEDKRHIHTNLSVGPTIGDLDRADKREDRKARMADVLRRLWWDRR
jgi:septal ring factor EnvC (AmiA/AmiB activator)